VAERDRPDDDDLDFEFFEDEPRTVETSARPTTPAQRGPAVPKPGPMRPRGPGGGTPIVRLAALIGGIIVIAVLIVVGVTSCRGDKAKGDYEDYMQSVGGLARSSDDVGSQFTQLLGKTGLTLDELQSQLTGLADQQAQVVQRTGQLEAPGAMLEAQQGLVDAMQLRENGLRGMAQAVSQIQPSTDPTEAGKILNEQGNRLIAGDVVYADSFQGRAEAVLKQEGVSGVQVPDSVFLTDPDLVSTASMTAMIERINQGGGGTETGGAHGNGITRVVVQPDGAELSPDIENEIVVTEGFAIEVFVENSGDFQETNVKVNLTIQGQPAIKKSATIEIVNPGETATVTFTDFVELPYATSTTLKIAVKPVEGEQNTANNSVDYPILLTLA